MRRRIWRLRTLLIAAVIVVLAVGIVFASIPFLPKPPHRSILVPVTKELRGQNQGSPGVYALTLRNITSDQIFSIGVSVTNGTGSFCVIAESRFLSWVISNSTNPSYPFPWAGCILQQSTIQSTLTFTPPNPGNWDVVAVNTNPQKIVVEYTPA